MKWKRGKKLRAMYLSIYLSDSNLFVLANMAMTTYEYAAPNFRCPHLCLSRKEGLTILCFPPSVKISKFEQEPIAD